MRQLVVIEFVTLDGVMQGLGSADEDRSGGFEHGGWGAAYMDDELLRSAVDGQKATTAYLLGRRTYERMAAHWPNQPADDRMAAHLNSTSKYVASRTLSWPKWANTQVIASDLVAAVNGLKARGEGTVAVLGSGQLVQALVANDLIDGYRIFLHPLLLGTGKRLFRELDRPRKLRLLDARPTRTGVVMLSYSTRA